MRDPLLCSDDWPLELQPVAAMLAKGGYRVERIRHRLEYGEKVAEVEVTLAKDQVGG